MFAKIAFYNFTAINFQKCMDLHGKLVITLIFSHVLFLQFNPQLLQKQNTQTFHVYRGAITGIFLYASKKFVAKYGNRLVEGHRFFIS
jgi:hypothetical protein